MGDFTRQRYARLRLKCQHCSNIAQRPRQLCQPCYFDLEIRAMYPSLSKYARCGAGIGEGGVRGGNQAHDVRVMSHGQPTEAVPGSEEKVEAMCKRAAECRPIFHPADKARELV